MVLPGKDWVAYCLFVGVALWMCVGVKLGGWPQLWLLAAKSMSDICRVGMFVGRGGVSRHSRITKTTDAPGM